MNPLEKRWAVELKVKAMTGVTALCSIGIATLNDVKADNSLIPGPAWVQALVLVVIPTGISFLTGYKTRHTPRDVL
jgi:hypothetical protein